MKWPFVRRSKYNHLTKCLDAKNDIIANQMENIKTQFNEINRLNQELANELNSHRETKEHEQKLFEAHDKLNQQNMGLLFENEKLLKQINQLRFDKSHLKQKVKKLESEITKCKAELELAKNHVNWFYGNYARFKDMIEKSGYYKRIN